MRMVLEGNSAKRPIGVLVFGWLLIISSLIHIYIFIFGYFWYWHLFDYLSDWQITVRYCGSWLLRILGISAGIGLLEGSKIARRIAIGISIYSILTLYWKHYYPAFTMPCQLMSEAYESIYRQLLAHGWSLDRLCTTAWTAQNAIDFVFHFVLLCYLYRPSIQKYFQRGQSRS